MARPGCSLSHVESGKGVVDILTNALGAEKHAVHVHGLTLTDDVCLLVLTQDGIVMAAAFFKSCTKLCLDDEDCEQGLGDLLFSTLDAVADDNIGALEL